MNISVLVADESHTKYAQAICDEMAVSAKERGTGIAKRSPDYIAEKMRAGKAVIAVTDDGRFAGFSYIESWEGKQFVANSGLIVAHEFRGIGLAKSIKQRIFRLSRELYPAAVEQRYKFTPEPDAAGYELLEAAGRKRGFLVSGGEVNTERMAHVLLDEFRAGKLGRITLERP